MDFIRTNNIHGVVFLSGDRHYVGVFKLVTGTSFRVFESHLFFSLACYRSIFFFSKYHRNYYVFVLYIEIKKNKNWFFWKLLSFSSISQISIFVLTPIWNTTQARLKWLYHQLMHSLVSLQTLILILAKTFSTMTPAKITLAKWMWYGILTNLIWNSILC